jgi:uncharacterized membrane protein YhhN
MKNSFKVLNLFFIILEAILLYVYHLNGGIVLKGIASGGFVFIGIINLIYALICKCKAIKFVYITVLGLIFSMLGDIILSSNFIVGALIFAIGHICYFIAFCAHKAYENKDVIPSAILFILSLSVLFLTPYFDFGGALMTVVVMVYALIISFMLGKAISVYLKEKSILNLLIVIGGALFFFSDVMLVFLIFGGAPALANTLCLLSYWPGQTILAFSTFVYVNFNKQA